MRGANIRTAILAVAAVLCLAAFPVRADVAHLPLVGKVMQTDAALRDLWVGHAFWVRNVVIATAAHNKAAVAAAETQVVANARGIAAAIAPLYGQPAADQLFALLAGHYGAVNSYLQATLAGSVAKQAVATKQMTDNAVAIATFLSSANPHLSADAVKGLLIAHGGHHVQQIHQIQAKQYADEAQTWAAMSEHMYAIADALTGALAMQFPDRFASAAR